MKIRYLFVAVAMFNGFLFTFPNTIKIQLDSSIPGGTPLKLQWLNRVSEGNYVLSNQMMNVPYRGFITVPRAFIAGKNMKRYDTHGFYISSVGNYELNKFTAQALFPYNDSSSLTYTYGLQATLSLSENDIRD